MTTSPESTDYILLVEDSTSLSMVYQQYLKLQNMPIVAVTTGKDCLVQIENKIPTILLLDLGLPDMDGIDILKKVRDSLPNTSVVVITNNASLGTAISSMKLGAFDYVVKPFSSERLNTTLRNARERISLRKEVQLIKSDISRETYQGFIGASLPMQIVYRIIEGAASSQATIFITGESGTGKEVCAQAIHNASGREKKAFVALNCAAIPRELMESEMFGHVKGAFSGAMSDREGAAALADGGTLFLDEICEMDIELQAKFLRLIQTGTYQRVGSSKSETSNLRIVCATNRDPVAEVRAGRFREDLYYRVHVIPIHLPTLRERGDDILLIANRLLQKYAGEENKNFKTFSPEAATAITTYPWPGNVREMQNAIRNTVVLNNAEIVDVSMFPRWMGNMLVKKLDTFEIVPPPQPAKTIELDVAGLTTKPSHIRPLWQVERDAIQNALRICNGNVTRAAAFLEVGASTLYRKKMEFESNQQQVV